MAAEAKTTLLLAVQKGPFWRPCPGTRDYICCGYQVLQVGLNCPMDCTYCVLQGYLNIPAITVFVNVEDLLAELEPELAAPGEGLASGHRGVRRQPGPGRPHGPQCPPDSLLCPAVPGRAGDQEQVAPMEPLLPGPNPQVIFAWSLNPPEIIRSEERGAASLTARLQAASRAAAAGFRLAFHFDPLIFFPGWEDAYRRTVGAGGRGAFPGRRLDQPGRAALFPAPARLIHQRFPLSRIAAHEMVGPRMASCVILRIYG